MNLLIIFAAKYLYLFIGLIALVTFGLGGRSVKAQWIKLSIFTFPLSLIIAQALNRLILSPRPFIVENMRPLIEASSDNGFPSDHTLLSMTIATVIFAYNKQVGSLLIVLSVIVGIARVLAQVHHPIDVIGSVIIAVIATLLSYRYAVKKFVYPLPYLES
jgi:undecaprenyl-diphosphatase